MSPNVEERDPILIPGKSYNLFGVLHKPVGKGQTPAILMVHGFAGNKVGRYRAYVEMAERLCRLGYVVLRFDMRGCGDSEGHLLDVTMESMVEDIQAALHFLSYYPLVNPERIGIMARSLGCPTAVMAARSIKAMVLWAPVFSGSPWKALTLDKNALQKEQQQLNDQLVQEVLNLNLEEPLRKLEAIPLLVLHGCLDQTVPADQMDGYAAIRQHATSASRFERFPASDHEFSDLDERHAAMALTEEWFQKWI